MKLFTKLETAVKRAPSINAIYRTFNVMSKESRKKYRSILVMQTTISLLDLFGLLIFASMASLAVSQVEGTNYKFQGFDLNSIASFFGVDKYQFNLQMAILGGAVSSFFLVRTVGSMLLLRKMMYFLAKEGGKISLDLFDRILSSDSDARHNIDSHKATNAITEGVNRVVIGILGSLATLVADVFLIVLILFTLLLFDIKLVLLSLFFFLIVVITIHQLSGKNSVEIGQEKAKTDIETSSYIQMTLINFREAFVRGALEYSRNKVFDLRIKNMRAAGSLWFLPYIGKYALETAIVLGGFLLVAFQIYVVGTLQAGATIAIFLVAGSRLAPALLKVQQGFMYIKGAAGQAEDTYLLFEATTKIKDSAIPEIRCKTDVSSSVVLSFEDVCFKFSGAAEYLLSDVTFEVKKNEFVAITGKSGVGKSTLLDIALGLKNVQKGKICLFGEEPNLAVIRNPGRIAYIPQNVFLSNKSILENVGYGFDMNEIDFDQVRLCLERVKLMGFINSLSNGVNTPVGELGNSLSGGQRQKLSFARAIYTNPELIVLDEATSALDIESEAEILEVIRENLSAITFIAIAHRGNILNSAHRILSLASGKVKELSSN